MPIAADTTCVDRGERILVSAGLFVSISAGELRCSGAEVAAFQCMLAQEAYQLAHDRVRQHSAAVVNERIDQRTRQSIESTTRGGRDAIVRRLAELEQEWDIDRALMVNFALAGGLSFATGLHRYTNRPLFGRRRKGLLYLFGSQLGFLLLHGVAGWCPPATVFRRLGFRTQREIDAERSELQSALAAQQPA